MTKQDLIEEFELFAIETTQKSIIKIHAMDPEKKQVIMEEYQQIMSNRASEIIGKAIHNNIEDRIELLQRIAEITVDNATKLSIKHQGLF